MAKSHLAPKSVYSCLTVLLEGAIHGMLPQTQPQHHERCLAVLSHLASTPGTRSPTLDVLRSNSILLQQLDYVGCAALRPEPDQVCSFQTVAHGDIVCHAQFFIEFIESGRIMGAFQCCNHLLLPFLHCPEFAPALFFVAKQWLRPANTARS